MNKKHRSISGKSDSHLFGDRQMPVPKKVTVTFCLIALTLACFWPCLQNGFTFWDDPTYLMEYMTLRHSGWPAVVRIFTEAVSKTYIPLSSLSYWIEFQLFGLNPFVFHLDNLLLHLANVVLVFFLALKMNFPQRAAFVAALLFGIHPLHVEAVAWVTSRKDVLYTFFYLLAMLAYVQYIYTKNWAAYGAALVFGFLSILAKPMALSLVFILGLLDWFFSRRWSLKLIGEKIPFLLYLVPVAWLTYRIHARVPAGELGPALMTWIWCFTFYMKKFFWPAVLLPLYLMPGSFHHFEFDLSIVILIAMLVLLVRFRKDRLWMFAVIFYFGSVFFLLRFDTQKDLQVVADRYMYLPSAGFCLFAGYMVQRLFAYIANKKRFFKIGACAIILAMGLILGGLTFGQCRLWGDEEKMWARTIACYPASITYQKMGDYFYLQDLNDQARPYYVKAYELDPQNYEVLLNLATIYADRMDYPSAFAAVNQAITQAPDYTVAYVNRAVMLAQAGQLDAAVKDLSRAVELEPRNETAYMNRGLALTQMGVYPQAEADFNRALEINPLDIAAFYNRGLLYLRQEQFDKAGADFKKALEIDPGFVPAQMYLRKIEGLKD